MIKIIYLIFYACFCLWFAERNATWIEQGKRIKHFWNGLIHVSAAILALYLFGWKVSLSVLLVARLVFDTALNLFRDLPVDYVSPNPKSIVDKVENYLFKSDGFSPKLVYLLTLFILQLT